MFTKAFLVLAARWLATGAMSAGLLWVIVGHLGPETAEVVITGQSMLADGAAIVIREPEAEAAAEKSTATAKGASKTSVAR